jgi:FlaA1/EpsC-like NDP-sugar epimerase
MDLAETVARYEGLSDYDVKITGVRRGEKIHECIRTGHDYCITSDRCEKYTDQELMELVEKAL